MSEKWPVRVDKSEGGRYAADILDIVGVMVAFGDSLGEALVQARKGLALCIMSLKERDLPIPNPSEPAGDDIYFITPDWSILQEAMGFKN